MATFLLIRHATCEGLGQRLAGRMAGVHLTEKGRQEAARTAERLARARIAAIYSSPLERALETTQALAHRLNVPWHIEDDLNEIDYGEWTGKSFEQLKGVPAWSEFNSSRSSAQIPGGENMQQVRRRARRAIERLRKTHVDALIALVSHADWIRAAAAEYSDLSLDALKVFQVDPASVSVLHIGNGGSPIIRWNDTGPLV